VNRAGGAGTAGPAPLRPRRAEVVDVLRAADSPLGAAQVADQVGLHVNTARFHLDALVAEGSAVRTLEEPSGPGRPRVVYAPRPGMDRGGERGYLLLARILLGHLSSSGADAGRDALAAGRAWGGFLAERPAPSQRLTAAQGVERLGSLLTELGFQPAHGTEPRDGRVPTAKRDERHGDDDDVPHVIRLRHCPFLELAEESGPLVCGVHLGLMRGALAAMDAPLSVTELDAFAEPDACLVRLEPADAAVAR
jgi:predicted ArsR family transcriptional regulator